MTGYTRYRKAPPRSQEWYLLRRQRQRDRSLGYNGYRIRVAQIADPENLYSCYQALRRDGGRAPGVDGYTYEDFSPTEVGAIVRDLSHAVLSGRYRPQPVRLAPIPKPGTDEHRILKIGTLCDRVVGKALHRAFTGFWEARFLDSSYGFRPRRNTWRMTADLEVSLRTTGWRALAINDVRHAFDNVPIDTVVECHRRALEPLVQRGFTRHEKERTLALIESVLRGHDQNRQRGIDQGAPYSPIALNVLLHFHHDLPLHEKYQSSLLPFRYADNLVYLFRSMSEGAQALSKIGRILEPLGLSLKFDPDVRDLTHEHEIQLLGFALQWEDSRLRLKPGSDSPNDLAQRLDLIHAEPNPTELVAQTILGWVDALGPAFEDGDVAEILSVAVRHGFRELPTRDLVENHWKNSWTRWQACRKRAMSRAGIKG